LASSIPSPEEAPVIKTVSLAISLTPLKFEYLLFYTLVFVMSITI